MATTTSSTHAVTGPALDNRRIAAAAIDLAAPLLAAVALMATDLLTLAVALVLIGWTLYYFFALESGGGQTLGKRAMHLKVVSADGGEPTMQQYAMRTITRVVDTPGIGLLVMLGTGDRRQRIGDIAAHTSVVDATADAPVADAFDVAPLQAEPAAPAAKPKRSRPSLGGPELKLPSFGRSKGPKEPKAPKPAKPAKPDKPAKEKTGRPTLGGPDLKMPSFGRSKAPKEPKEPKPAKPAKEKTGRPTLGGPELKMPSFGRSKAPKEPKPPKPPKPAKEKTGRPTLGGPELKMPSFGRKKKKYEPVVFEPEPPAPEPEPPAPEPDPPAPEPPAPEPEPAAFDPFAEDAPEPSVEVVAHDEPPANEPEPPAPEIMQRDAPEVEIVREDDFADEAPAPAPPPPAPPAEEPLPAAAEHDPEPEPEPEPELEPEHVEGIRDDGSSRVNVKPIETVSAMDLLMREAEEQDRQGSDR